MKVSIFFLSLIATAATATSLRNAQNTTVEPADEPADEEPDVEPDVEPANPCESEGVAMASCLGTANALETCPKCIVGEHTGEAGCNQLGLFCATISSCDECSECAAEVAALLNCQMHDYDCSASSCTGFGEEIVKIA